VSGWSYGGYMTTWLIGHYHVWKAAVAGASVTDWTDTYNLADWNVLASHELGGSPWTGDVEKVYRAQSPITYAPQSTTPTLILADTGDVRVPITQSIPCLTSQQFACVFYRLSLYGPLSKQSCAATECQKAMDRMAGKISPPASNIEKAVSKGNRQCPSTADLWGFGGMRTKRAT